MNYRKRFFCLTIIYISWLTVSNSIAQPLSAILPKYNSFISTENVEFLWNEKSSSISYQIFVASDPQFSSNVTQSPILFTNNWTVNLIQGTWYWKVVSSDGTNTFESGTSRFVRYNPGQENSLSFWINADSSFVLDGANKVEQINDLSNNQYVLSQTNSTKRPTVVNSSFGGHPSYSFSGAQWFSGGDILDVGTNSRAFFCVAKMAVTNQTVYSKTVAAAANSRYALLKDGSQTAFIYQDNTEHHNYTATNSTNFALYTNLINRPQATHRFYINSVLVGTKSINAAFDHNSTSRFLLGAYNNATNNGELLLLNGNISEIFFLDTSDSLTIERGKLYIKHKYHTLDLGPDKINDTSFCATTLTVPSGFSNPTWSTGQTSTSISVSSEGLYWLKAFDPLGFEWYDTIFVDYPDIPSPPVNGICSGGNVVWNADLGAGFSYQWSNGPTTPSVSITSPGNYSVTVTGFGGCQKTSPVETFYIDNYEQTTTLGPDTLMCSGNTLSLQIGASETVSYLWPDGSDDPTYPVDTIGNYYVTTTNVNGCTAQDTIHVTITGQAPIANFSAADFCFEESVDFTDLSMPVGGDDIDNWTWNFGDGTNASVQNPSHTYSTPGSYSVMLSVESQGGCKENITKVVKVRNLPYANFSTTNFCENDTIYFTDNTSQGDTTLLEWAWDFGQPSQPNNTSALPNPAHLYNEFGAFNVKLEIRDNHGCVNDTTIVLDVKEAPNAAFTFDEACENDPVNLSNQSTIGTPNSIVSYNWQFDDNTTSSQTNPNKTYSEYGLKTILLTANANNGCADTTYGFVEIHDIPFAVANVAPACVGTFTALMDNSVCFTDTIQDSEWYIDFTDNAEGNPAYYVFQTPGNHKVILVTRSSFGCQNDTLVNINVAPELSADWEFFPQTVVADQEVEFTYEGLNGTIFQWDFGNGVVANTENPILVYSDDLAGTNVPVQLIVSNGTGCLDTMTRNLEIKRGELELLVQNIFFQDIDGFLTTGVQLVNQGTVRIDSIRLDLRMSNGSQFLEYCTSPLLSGESKIYVLQTKPSSFYSEYDEEDAWICVEGEPVPSIDIDEIDLSNNNSCINTEGERPILIGPNPNPLSDRMQFEVLLETDTEINITLINSQGQSVKSIIPLSLMEAGKYSYDIRVDGLSAGVYYLQLRYPTGQLFRKLIVL